ncbi:3-hydroxyacyl-ACP dehydratase FabZ [Chryseobacterium rhizosphaerae]|uniref:3-hydroxyacyl-[acyl-carrier-protein] dehydratase n=1 Tax=Chryseobacterium rhizosphaerae TaxID=395937 RepID=A0AAE4C0N2_9FLAO|nr:3-hydroxyacyl-ACP dehydratase FabZ [Chryseobacterium rhizosphaerae]MDR6524673.1 3-hydroxyacyl-[acyl-carrier-protein] dehydratase [Chryseobacterium rhizosphaerae]REC73473.1 3-hydroxyacyl-[acyl-carrier-protein] dehydratase FabZ [Chryseobacterium rhizosphaerae]GEN68631.1 3-hydroxyacyl-[acyl-carrier-protein] dehydratase FabZ [Chryseobacterium rhizosphaerae]
MKAILESYQISQIVKYRYPFLLIDKVTEYVKGERLKAVKAVSMGEPYFSGHFPDFPIMPGVLITEALAQTSSLMTVLDSLDWQAGSEIPTSEATSMGVLGSVQISFLQSVLPGNLLELEVSIDWKKGSASSVNVKASVEGSICAKGKITVMSVDKSKISS